MDIYKSNKVPEHSLILKNWHHNPNYVDSYATDLLNPGNLSVDVLATMIFASDSPKWERALIKLRDTVVSLFGLKRSSDQEKVVKNERSEQYNPGDRIGFFPVVDRSESEIVMGMNDKHLEFRASIFLNNNQSMVRKSLTITTVVKYVNLWGQIYFSVVMPFHKVIVKQSIRRLLKRNKEFMLEY